MPLQTNFTITGSGLVLKDDKGNPVGNQSFALVQWQYGYDPAQHPFAEWSMNPILVSWAGTYTPTPNKWKSVAVTTSFDSPMYVWLQLSTDSNQSGLWQVTNALTLDGTSQTIDMSKATIRSVVGDSMNNSLRTADIRTWTPTAVPEPSYIWFSFIMLCAVLVYKVAKMKK
jgi:hypothetical protein